jgi:hypothetical protein
VKNGNPRQTLTTITEIIARTGSLRKRIGRSTRPVPIRTWLKTPPTSLYIHIQIRTATSVGSAQGRIMIERMMPRAGIDSFSASATTVPMISLNTTDVPAKIRTLRTTVQKTGSESSVV